MNWGARGLYLIAKSFHTRDLGIKIGVLAIDDLQSLPLPQRFTELAALFIQARKSYDGVHEVALLADDSPQVLEPRLPGEGLQCLL
jgi:hypothetical protein